MHTDIEELVKANNPEGKYFKDDDGFNFPNNHFYTDPGNHVIVYYRVIQYGDNAYSTCDIVIEYYKNDKPSAWTAYKNVRLLMVKVFTWPITKEEFESKWPKDEKYINHDAVMTH